VKINLNGRRFCFAGATALTLLLTIRGGAQDTIGPFNPPMGNLPSADSGRMAINDSTRIADSAFLAGESSTLAKAVSFETLGGNLPKVVENHGMPYLVTSDIYVPSGKTVRIEPGVILLFRNFTGMHVEGRLVAEGTSEKPIVFSSEFDKMFNPSSALHANPYDWNGITIHENGLGSSFSDAKLMYSVFGINSLTKYIKLDKMHFSNNGRSDLVIEGKIPIVSAQSFTYALTIDDARKDGVPVKILMDPRAKKRTFFRYSGLSFLAAGCATAIWSATQLRQDGGRLTEVSDAEVVDENSNLVKNEPSVWESASSKRNWDTGVAVIGSVLAVLGGAGFGFSFTF
jgi:hypothetical protein